MSQPIGGDGSITKAGAGTLILGAANTYTGGTTISAGTLRITNPLALQNSTVTLSGGTLDLNNLAASVGGLAGTGNVDLRGQVLTLGGSNQDSTFAGNIISSSGVASVEKVGTGTINLTGTNTYTGGTVLRSGALGITTDANIGGATSAITFDGGLLRINGTTLTTMGSHVVNWSTFDGGFDIDSSSHTFTVSQAISGSGSLTKRGAGRLVLSSYEQQLHRRHAARRRLAADLGAFQHRRIDRGHHLRRRHPAHQRHDDHVAGDQQRQLVDLRRRVRRLDVGRHAHAHQLDRGHRLDDQARLGHAAHERRQHLHRRHQPQRRHADRGARRTRWPRPISCPAAERSAIASDHSHEHRRAQGLGRARAGRLPRQRRRQQPKHHVLRCAQWDVGVQPVQQGRHRHAHAHRQQFLRTADRD